MIHAHIDTLAITAPCHACGEYAHQGMHVATDAHAYHPQCCPDCRKRSPLEDGEIAEVRGEQGNLFS